MQFRWLIVALTLFVSCGSCDGPQSASPRAIPAEEQRMAIDSAQDHLLLAMDFIDQYHKYDERENMTRIAYHLNKWVEGQRADDKWIADPMFSRLPSRLTIAKNTTALTKLEMNNADIGMLREALWLNNLARQLANREITDRKLRSWVQSLPLNSLALRDLSNVIEIFDWTVRNIQLESSQTARQFAEEVGIDPPRFGSFRMPWESLLLGRGDAWVRAQIAIGIARQLSIPMVVLSVDQENGARPWVIAALIDKQLYLFDPTLGLPVPNLKGDGIATFEEVMAEPTELALKIDREATFFPDPQQLKRIVAQIDAPLPYLTQKMWILQRALPAKYKLILSVAPSALAQELRQIPGVTNVSIWELPYDAVAYRMSQFRNVPFMARLDAFTRPFSGDNALANGRRQHIRGVFSSEPPEKGAKQYYLDCRLPDAELANLRLTAEVRSILGIEGALPDDKEFVRAFLQSQSARLEFFKRHASYFLGLIAFEEGKYDVAIDYFENRTLKADPDGVFVDGAKYGLARCYEQLGILNDDPQFINKAISILQADQSPQAAGNHLRAKKLTAEYDSPSAQRP